MKTEANKLLVSTVKKLLHRDGTAQLKRIIARTHPADLAHVFNFLTRGEQREFFACIEAREVAAELLTETEPRTLSKFLDVIDDRELVRLLELMSADDTADVLEMIEDEERKELLLTMMHRDELVTTQSLLEYDPESAGGLMVPHFFALDESTTVAEALRKLQEDAGRTEVVFYLYVVNEHGHLVGVTSLRELVLTDPAACLREFMITELVRVDVDTDQEEVARLIARYNLVALPVVDGNNQLVGVVTVDDIIDVIRLEATEDMMLMAGAGDQQVDDLSAGVLSSVRARIPWMLPTFLGATASAWLLWGAREELTVVAPAMAAIPLVMMMAGNIGTQSAAIVTRGIALRRTDFVALGRVVLGELGIGAFVGTTWGLLVAAGTFFAFGDALPAEISPAHLALTHGVALWVAMSVSAAVGALLPMVFSRLAIDPAIATGPLVAAVSDVIAVAALTSALFALVSL